MNGTQRFAAAALLAALVFGCAAKKPQPVEPPPEPTTAPAIVILENIQRRAKNLRINADALAEVNRKLPGRTVAEDNQLVAEALGYLGAALSDLGGANPDGAHRQQVEIVFDAQAKLLNAPAEIAEPTIDSALRAAYNALAGVQRKHFRGHKEITELVEKLRTELPALDRSHDPLKRTPVSEIFNAISQVVQAMTRVIEAHAMSPYPPDPATMPATAPTTGPGTRPTTSTTTGPATTRAATRPASAPMSWPATVPATRPAG